MNLDNKIFTYFEWKRNPIELLHLKSKAYLLKDFHYTTLSFLFYVTIL